MKLPFIKPAWQHQDAQKRLTAAAGLDPDNSQELDVLKQLGLGDTEESVRSAAMQRIEDVDWLLANLSIPAAEARLQQVLIGLPSSSGQLCDQLATLPQQLLASLAQKAQCADLRQRALELLESDEMIVEVACYCEAAQTRHAAAHRLQSELQLQQVWQVARDKDKGLARELRERLDLLKLQRERAEAAAQRANELAVAMQELAEATWSGQYNARFAALVNEWQELEAQYPDLPSESYRAAAILAEAVVNEHRKVAESMRRRQQVLEQIEELQQQLQQAELDEAGLSRLLESWSQLRRDWVDCDADSLASEQEQARFEQATARFAWLEQWRQQLQPRCSEMNTSIEELPGDTAAFADLRRLADNLKSMLAQIGKTPFDSPPIEVVFARQQLQQHLERINSALEEHQNRLKSAEKLVASIRNVIKAGNLQKANVMRRKLDGKLEKLDQQQRSRLADRLSVVDEELQKLQGWKSFATLPKFQQYCDAMEALANEPLEPQKQVQQVRQLQEDWKALKMNAPEELWQQFQDTGHRAWQPCAEWFDQQEQQRLKHQQQREELLEQLQALLPQSEDEVDWRELRKSFRSLSSQWRDSGPAPRSVHGKQQKRWSKAAKKVHALLYQHYQENKLVKQRLVEQARALTEEPRDADATGRMKQLQQQWRQVGIVDPGDERKLWKQFQAAGDQLFKLERESVQQQQAARDAELAALAARVEELQQQQNSDALDSQKLRELQADMAQVVPTHKGDRAANQLLTQWRQFETGLADERKRQRQEKLEHSWKQVLDVAQGNSDPETLPASIAEQLSTPEPSDKKAGETLREIRIQLELLLGQDSSSEDAELRMQLQMRRLQQGGVGQAKTGVLDDQVRNLLQQWLQIGPGAGNRQQREQLAALFMKTAEKGITPDG